MWVGFYHQKIVFSKLDFLFSFLLRHSCDAIYKQKQKTFSIANCLYFAIRLWRYIITKKISIFHNFWKKCWNMKILDRLILELIVLKSSNCFFSFDLPFFFLWTTLVLYETVFNSNLYFLKYLLSYLIESFYAYSQFPVLSVIFRE